MRSYEEYSEILRLWEDGKNKFQIAILTGIPRATVRDVIDRFGSLAELNNQIQKEHHSTNVEIASYVLELWEAGKSQVEICEITEYSRYSVAACIEQFRSLNGLKKYIEQYGTVEEITSSRSPKTQIRSTIFTDQDLIDAVKSSTSLRQVLIKLNIRPAGGNYQTIKKKLQQLNLDTSHFRGKGWLKNRRNPYVRKTPLSEILVENSTYSSSNDLRRRLLNEGIFEAICDSCGLETWLDQPIPLELDHINGDRRDNRLENLRLLCPNCHALTETYRGKNIQLTITS